MFNTKSQTVKLSLLAGVFVALLSSNTVLGINLGIFKILGDVLSYLPFAWIILLLLYGFFVARFTRRTAWYLWHKTESISETVLLFAILFVIVGALPHLSPIAPVAVVITQAIFALIIAPLFCWYAGMLLGFLAPRKKGLEFFLYSFWSMAFVGLGLWFFGLALLGLFGRL